MSELPHNANDFTPSCTCPPPSYNWTLSCPGAAAKTFSGENATIVAAPGGDIETSNMTQPAKCPLALLVTDSANASASAATTVTVMCARGPPGVTRERSLPVPSASRNANGWGLPGRALTRTAPARAAHGAP